MTMNRTYLAICISLGALALTGCFTAEDPDRFACTDMQRGCPEGYTCNVGSGFCEAEGDSFVSSFDGQLPDAGMADGQLSPDLPGVDQGAGDMTIEADRSDDPDHGIKPDKGFKPDQGGSVAPRWVTIGAGTFQMGSPASEPCQSMGGGNKERLHSVTLTHSFKIQDLEVTQGQFKTLMGYNPSKFTACGTDCPVEQLSWHEAAAYCNALSANQGLASCYSCTSSGPGVMCKEATSYAGKKIYGCPGYRLPTEAEWEYSYRAGTTSAFYNGKISSCTSNDASASAIGWYSSNTSKATRQVGLKQPNAWGLYDMAGNVYEWCHDLIQSDLGSAPVVDPVGTGQLNRVRRGGSWKNSPFALRAAFRMDSLPIYSSDSLGFRPVRTVSCSDKIKNGDETDVDCGGKSCNKCADTKKCAKGSDCLSGICANKVCASGCKHQPVVKDCSKDASGAQWCKVPGGCFVMGSPASEPCREPHSSHKETQHQVVLTRSFEIHQTEVTLPRFTALMKYNPSTSASCGPTCPARATNWHEAAAYCNALSQERGYKPCYACTNAGGKKVSCKDAAAYAAKIQACPGYRLPTEAEWEYAYRAGTKTALHNGAIDKLTCSGCTSPGTNANKVGWHCGNSGKTVHPVATKAANAWGLYDMAGNLNEWCQDWFVSDPGSAPVVDPVGTKPSSMRASRSGAYNYPAGKFRAAYRGRVIPTAGYGDMGLRCVRSLNP